MARADSFRFLVISGFLSVLTLAINQPVLDYDWVYFDDDINIVLNPHLTGVTSDSLAWAWTDVSYSRRYMPLGWMLFDGLFAFGGLNPAVFHCASWLLATANALLLLVVMRRFLARTGQPDPGGWWPEISALAAVLLFAMHPLRAVTVGWASSLLYLGSTCLGLLATLASFPVVAQPPSAAREWAGRILYLLSLLVYPVTLALPLLLAIAAAGTLSPRTLLPAARRYGSWLAIALVIGAVNLAAAARSSLFGSAQAVADYPLGERIQETAARVSHYIEFVLWPGATAPFYGRTDSMGFAEKYLVILVASGVLVGLIAWRRTRRTAATFSTLCLLALLPFAGFVDRGQTASDRFAFVLLHVLAIGLALALARLRPGPWRLVPGAGVALLAVVLVPAYRRSLAIWQDTATMQARMDAVAAAHPDPRLNFARPAMHEFLSGRPAESQARLRAGFARFGAHPELVSAARFIEETRLQLASVPATAVYPPYVTMHLQLARTHQVAGHSRAAHAHEQFAQRLMAARN